MNPAFLISLLFLSCFNKAEDDSNSDFIDTSDSLTIDSAGGTEGDTSEPETTADTHEPQGPPFAVLSNSPSYGPTSGGTEVHIIGEDFPIDLEVFFGNILAPVLELTPEHITVTAPPMQEEGLYNIQIRTEEGTVSHNESFQYYEESTGQTGLLGSFEVEETIGSYWPTPTLNFDAKLLFIRSQDIHWWQLSTDNFNSCTHNDLPPNTSVYPLDFSNPFLELTNTQSSIVLVWDTFHTLYEESSSQYIPLPDQEYSLHFTEGDISGTTLPQILYTSHALVLYDPLLEQITPPRIRIDQSFSWLPSGGSWISIRLAKVDPDTGNYTEQIRCVVEDDGSFQIDPNLWNNWSVQQQIDIYVSRSVETISVLPHNLSEARIVGTHTLIGAGISQ